MHEVLCFAAQNVPRKMGGEGLPRDGSRTVPAGGGSCSDRPRINTDTSGFIFSLRLSIFEGSLAQKLRLHIF